MGDGSLIRRDALSRLRPPARRLLLYYYVVQRGDPLPRRRRHDPRAQPGPTQQCLLVRASLERRGLVDEGALTPLGRRVARELGGDRYVH